MNETRYAVLPTLSSRTEALLKRARGTTNNCISLSTDVPLSNDSCDSTQLTSQPPVTKGFVPVAIVPSVSCTHRNPGAINRGPERLHGVLKLLGTKSLGLAGTHSIWLAQSSRDQADPHGRQQQLPHVIRTPAALEYARLSVQLPGQLCRTCFCIAVTQ